jgi:hypothetical protein
MRNSRILLLGAVLPLLLTLAACDDEDKQPAQSTSGVHQAQVKVQTGSDGLTMEQRNVRKRLVQDNTPGALEYLYVISPDSGQILMYSGVDGKVTSSGKRLAPRTVAAIDGEGVSSEFNGIAVTIGGQTRRTTEVLEDDGTYGDSVPYIYWWDTNGVYHQHFFTGGQIIHVTSAPLHVNSNQILIQLEHSSDAPASTVKKATADPAATPPK